MIIDIHTHIFPEKIAATVLASAEKNLALPPDEVVSIIRAHGVDKILFGTDFPWETQSRCLKYIRNLQLTEQEKEKILGANARRLLFGSI